MDKKVFYIFPFLIIGIFLFFYLNIDKKEINNVFLDNQKNQQNDNIIGYHDGKLISDLLNIKNYEEVGINPNDYETFNLFLEDFTNYEGLDFNPISEKFVIGKEDENGDITYVSFNFMNDNKIFDNITYKNLAILDIHSAYNDGLIYGGYNSNSSHKIIFERDLYHPTTHILSNILDVDLFNQNNNINNTISDLNKFKSLSKENEELLAYLYDFTGDFEKSNKIRSSYDDDISLKVNGIVKDEEGNFIDGAEVKILNFDEVISKSSNGGFSFEKKFFPYSHIRIKVSKDGYSDAFVTYSLNDSSSYFGEKEVSFLFNLNKADEKIVINSTNESEFLNAKYYILEMDGSKYFVPYDGLYYNNLNKYNSKDISIYLYQFTRDSNLENLLNNDTFEPVYGYVGNTMVTFGMPYIQIIDNKTGEELFTKSDNPIILQNKIFHMNDLYENTDGLYGAIDDEDLEYLLNYSNDVGGYPIDFDFIIGNDFLRWPARWTLDRKKGTWKNVGHRLIDMNGTVELPFYHIE